MQQVNTVVTDFDNTLFDWFDFWYASFQALVEGIEKKSGISQEELLPQIRKIHQQYGTSEYYRLVTKIPSLIGLHPGMDLTEIFADELTFAQQKGRESLRLYPNVVETLLTLKQKGVLLIIYTESQSRYSAYRLKEFGLDGIVDYLYTPDYEEESLLNQQAVAEDKSFYQLQKTIHKALPKEDIKPNPKVLTDILSSVGSTKEQTIYIGDSKMKDISMANYAGITSVLVKYGAIQNKEAYELLKKVSHWKDETIAREGNIEKEQIQPSFTIENQLSEILPLFNFTPYRND